MEHELAQLDDWDFPHWIRETPAKNARGETMLLSVNQGYWNTLRLLKAGYSLRRVENAVRSLRGPLRKGALAAVAQQREQRRMKSLKRKGRGGGDETPFQPWTRRMMV